MEGAFSESGPYHVAQFQSPPSLTLNPFTWNNLTHNLFIESPAGVGFSYCETASGCSHTDTSTASNSLLALRSFFAAFPELAGLPFYLTGESYAGIYIPMLAYAVYQYNSGRPAAPIALQGIMVGNGCIGNEAGHCGNDALNDLHDVQTFRGHGLISDALYQNIIATCNWAAPSLACDLLLAEAELLTASLDVYDLYNQCPDPASPAPPRRGLRAPVGARSMIGRRLARERAAAAAGAGAAVAVDAAARIGDDPECWGSGPALEAWANTPEVKAALHVAPGVRFALCSNNRTFNYNSDMKDERAVVYPTLTKQAGYRVVVYNGEADLCVPFTDNEWWTKSMNYTEKEGWAPWFVDGAHGSYLGGYRVNYDHNFTFATVRGAGHMVREGNGLRCWKRRQCRCRRRLPPPAFFCVAPLFLLAGPGNEARGA
jgi:serine carboxypeptidase-like clade 1